MNNDQTPLFQDPELQGVEAHGAETPGRASQNHDLDDLPHLATVSHDGRFWDVYVEFHEDAANSTSNRAALLFSPSDGGASGQGPVRTAVILVESSDDAIVKRAETFGDHQLVALLRSIL